MVQFKKAFLKRQGKVSFTFLSCHLPVSVLASPPHVRPHSQDQGTHQPGQLTPGRTGGCSFQSAAPPSQHVLTYRRGQRGPWLSLSRLGRKPPGTSTATETLTTVSDTYFLLSFGSPSTFTSLSCSVAIFPTSTT